MKKYSLLIAAIAVALVAGSASAQSCTPPWPIIIGPGVGGYEWIGNGTLANGTSCWTITGNVSLVATPGCTYEAAQAFDTHYGARISQQFTVPSNMTQTHWSLTYLLTMQDPHNDGFWNRLKARVYDVTTGQNLASQTYWGDDPDITCSLRTLNFTGNLANHTIQVIFSDGSSYSDTVFRFRGISLIQTN
jgi:hypothetical protein